MENEIKEIPEAKKSTPTLPVPFSKKAKKNMVVLQGVYQAKYGKKINLKALAGRILETATL